MNSNQQKNPRSLSVAETDNAAEGRFGYAGYGSFRLRSTTMNLTNYVQTQLIASLPSKRPTAKKYPNKITGFRDL